VKINIKKISELSGFSPATVSNALNNKRGVNRETAEQIIRIAREHGYITESKIKSIRVVSYRDSGEVFAESPFFSSLLESVADESRKQGYETTLLNLYRRKPNYEEQLSSLLSDTSSAILLVGTELSEEDALPFYETSAPLVLLDCNFDGLPFHSVLMDNVRSVYRAVNYLIEQGHRSIGYLRGSVRIRNFQCRERGFFLAMQKAGIPVEDKYIMDVQPSIIGSHDCMNRLLDEGVELPTAFFADNDMIALGAMQALQNHGYRIPEDISIIGFDDITFSKVFSPGLTTVRVHTKELGKLAVRRLIELIKKPQRIKVCTQLCTDLVLRGSVAARNAEE